MSAATARLVVQMTPEEKATLERRAKRAGLSTSEFVRRAVGGDAIEENREEIESLLTALETAAPTILRSLDATIAEAKAMFKNISAIGRETQS